MNYCNFIIKIVEKPKQTIINNDTVINRFRAEYIKNDSEKTNTIINVVLWGNSLDNTSSYFFVGDFIIIEGYISICNKVINRNGTFNTKEIEISVFKAYPFVF